MELYVFTGDAPIKNCLELPVLVDWFLVEEECKYLLRVMLLLIPITRFWGKYRGNPLNLPNFTPTHELRKHLIRSSK